MDFTLNPTNFLNMFAVPAVVADKHLKLSGEAQLKTLLWILRNGCENFDLNAAKRATGLSEQDINDSILYWINCAVLTKTAKSNQKP